MPEELKAVVDVEQQTTPTPATPPDPFDLENLRLPQAFAETAGVKKLLTTVPVHRPNPQDFCRVHPSPDYRMDMPIIELKDEREEYAIARELLPDLVGEFVTKTIYTAINKQGVVFLWPVRLPSPDGKNLEWWRSMREGAELAMTRWVRIKANMSLGAYELSVAESVMSDPTWPDEKFQKLVKLAFRDRMIATMDHAVIKRLRGLA